MVGLERLRAVGWCTVPATTRGVTLKKQLTILVLVLGGCFNPPTGAPCVPQPPNWCNPSGWCVYRLIPWIQSTHTRRGQTDGPTGGFLTGISGSGPNNVWVTQSNPMEMARPLHHWDGCHWTQLPAARFPVGETTVRVSPHGDVWAQGNGTLGGPALSPTTGRLVDGGFAQLPPGLPEGRQPPWHYRLDGENPVVTMGTRTGISVFRLVNGRWEVLPHRGALYWAGDRAQVMCDDGSCFVVQDGIRNALNGFGTMDWAHWAGPNALWIQAQGRTSFWNGETVEDVPLPPQVAAIHGIAVDKVVAVSRSQIHIWDGTSWNTEDLPGEAGDYYPGISAVWVAPTGHVWLTAGPHVYVRQLPL